MTTRKEKNYVLCKLRQTNQGWVEVLLLLRRGARGGHRTCYAARTGGRGATARAGQPAARFAVQQPAPLTPMPAAQPVVEMSKPKRKSRPQPL